MKKILISFLSIICVSLMGQDTPTWDDLIIDSDSMKTVYKPASKNYVFIRSKRGNDGVTKTSSADSVLALGLPITDIILVFTEDEPGDIAKREQANQERWENLLKTYPKFFQFDTYYKSQCQCNMSGDKEGFKQAQGFYIYFPGKAEKKAEEQKAVEAKVEVKKAEEKVAENSKKTKEPKEEKIKEEKPKKEKPIKEEKPKKEKEEKVAKVKEEKITETPVVEEPVAAVAVAKPKKEGYATPKKAKDAKVCRPPCYDGGDEGLNNFLRDNIILSKKQKRKSGDLQAVVTLMLHFDGSIKKSIVICSDPDFKKQVEEAVNMMDLWNPAVKGGVTIKSQVKLTLKYDNSSKQIKPFQTMIIPRPAPKCTECLSDSEVFND